MASLFVGGFLFVKEKMFNDKKENDAEVVLQEKEAASTGVNMDEIVEDDALTGKDSAATAQDDKKEDKIGSINISVPFTSQAPTGNWSESVFQNGCEEASIIMAMAWINGKTLDKESVEKNLRDLEVLEKKMFGHGVDTSAADTVSFAKKYYSYENIQAREIRSVDEISVEIGKGNLVLVPAYGRALKNPNYTQLGPITHMLVIVGIDDKTNEFITNDPGTKRGEKYRYSKKILFDAIWAYPSGKEHPQPPVGILNKAMIVVSKQ